MKSFTWILLGLPVFAGCASQPTAYFYPPAGEPEAQISKDLGDCRLNALNMAQTMYVLEQATAACMQTKGYRVDWK